jgi:folylpolyglutamate synthase/dihydropteroate synthase
MRDKDTAAMLRLLAPVAGAIVVTRASAARTTDPDTLAAQARAAAPGLPVVVAVTPREALAAAWRAAG